METKEFGVRLKELRKQAGLSQRELADKIGVNFTYLSKIESGAMPPPSEQVILRLAGVLDADKDELMLLAGKIPSDIAQILKNQKALQLLRASRTQKKIGAASKKERISIMKNLGSYKSLSKVAIPIVLVCAIAASLWFASPLPAKALEIEITNSQGTAAPTNGTLGNTYSFQVKVSIEDTELLPIKNIDLEIYNVDNSATYYDQYTNLALESTDYISYTTSGAGASVSIKATPDSMWGYFTTGVTSVTWKGTGYTFAPIVGGYGYASGTGTTAITYDIDWTPSSGWPTGDYRIEAKITAQDDKTFTQTSSSFSLAAPSAGGGGGGGGAAGVREISPGVYNVSGAISGLGKFRMNVTLDSADNNVKLGIDMNTTGKTKEGQPLSQISITEMAEPPAPPTDSYIIGLVYNLSPDGATLSPPITITFTYDPTKIPAGVNEKDLVIAIWDKTANKWVKLEHCIVDPVTHTITAPVSHFTAFTIIGAKPKEPAAFTVSDLSISPTEVSVGKSVTISVMVANTGDLTGSYKVTLKTDKVVVETSEVTLAGGASLRLTFTTAKDSAGTYTIDVNGLSGKFTVKAVEVPAKPAAFTTSTLTISPAEVDIGKSVTISVMVANTGDLTGSYEVTLKTDNVVVETKEITLAGGASQRVTFATAKDVAGTYTIDVNGLSGKFTVKAVELPPVGPVWWVWLILGVVVVVVAWLAYLLWWRRR